MTAARRPKVAQPRWPASLLALGLVVSLALGLKLLLLPPAQNINQTNTSSHANFRTHSGVWLLVVAAALLGGLAALQFVARRRRLFRLFAESNIPTIGRPRLLSGHLYQTFFKFDSIHRLDQYHKRLGKTYGLFYGPDPWVMTTDLALLERVFKTEASAHVNRNEFRLPMFDEFDKALVQLRGDQWRQARRLLGASFTRHQMKQDNVYAEIQRVCELVCDGIAAAAAAAAGTGGLLTVNLAHDAKRFTAETTSRLLYGCPRVAGRQFAPNQPDALVGKLARAVRLLNGRWTRLCVMFTFLRRPAGALVALTPVGDLLRHIHANLDHYVSLRGPTSVRRSSADGGGGATLAPRDDTASSSPTTTTTKRRRLMIDSLIEAFRQGKLGADMLRSSLFFLLVSGIETSSTVIALLCWHLARDPGRQARLLEAVARDGETSEYLDWCIRETIRLYPPVPTAVGRLLAHDLEHAGMRLRKGMAVTTNIWSLHRSREYWGEDAHVFRPERFGAEPPGPSAGDSATATAALRFFGFGLGPRYCIGQHLAMAQIRALITKLLLRFRLSPAAAAPDEIRCLSPNMIHLLIEGPVEVVFELRN